MGEIKNVLLTYDDLISKVDIGVLRKIANTKGYKIFDKGNYNLNIWGIRCNTENTKEFNDLLCVFYKENEVNPKMNGHWVYKWFLITTDPSDLNLLKPINSRGCAILKEGQHSGCFRLSKHKGEYPALVQSRPMPIIRDNNKDSNLDFNNKWDYEMAGINIHRASKWKIVRTIGLYSAGCQVFESVRDYEDVFMPLVERCEKLYGNSFTYTLLNIKDFF